MMFRISAWLVLVAVACTGCYRLEMYDQPRVDPFETSEFFEDGLGSREPIEGTVARGQLKNNSHLYSGLVNGRTAESFPFPVGLSQLKRGRERYEIFCSVCHGYTGEGDGRIVQRGFTRPASFHEERVRNLPVGMIFSILSNGYGAMPAYASQIPAIDRWLIIAYVRTLQYSQSVPVEELSAKERAILEGSRP